MNNRNLSDRLKKHFSLDDSLKHFGDDSRKHVLERFTVPEKIAIQDLYSAIIAIYKSNGFEIPAGSDYARRAQNGIFMFQGGNKLEYLHSVTTALSKNMPIAVTVSDLNIIKKEMSKVS